MKKGISLLAFVLAMLMVLTSCMPLSTLAPGSSQRPALPTTPEVKPTTPPGTVTTAPTHTTAPAVNETTAPPTTVTTATTASTATTAATEPVVPGGVYVDLDFDYGNNAIVDKKGNVVCTPVGNSAVKEVDVIHNGSVLKKNALVINDPYKQSWVECTFTNISDHAQLNKLIEEAKGWTVEAFYRNANKANGILGIVCVTESTTTTNHACQGWGLAEYNGAPYFITGSGNRTWFSTDRNSFVTNTTDFYHVVGVYDVAAQTNSIYINGELKSSVTATSFAAVDAFGKDSTGEKVFNMGTGFFLGGEPSVSANTVDFPVSDLTVVDVKLYAGALTAREVAKAYAEIAAEFENGEPPSSTTGTTVTTSTTSTTATTNQALPGVPAILYADLDFDYGNNAITDKKGNVVCTPVGNSTIKEVDVIHNGAVLKKNALVINDANKQSWVECTFTNIADYSQLNKLVEEARGWTVEAFYLNASKSTNLQGIVCVTEISQGWGLAERNGAPYLVTANGRSYFFAHSNYTTSTTEFYHVVGVYDAVSQTNKTYINGELKGEVQNVTGFAAAQATDKNGFVMGTGFFIGGDPSASSVGVDFPVSDLTVVDVKIYTGALTASEVAKAYAEIAAEFQGTGASKELAYVIDSDTTCKITGIGTCADTDIVIPSYIDGYKVTMIGYNAFMGCEKLTSVVIPDTVTDISANAFRECSNLTSVVIPGSVEKIYVNAFYGCSSLTSVVISDGVVSIDGAAFGACSSLTEVVIPDSVTHIGVSAFNHCINLKNIIIPDSVTSIEDSVFCWCENLTSVTLPSGITSIPDGMFVRCYDLTDIVIPYSVTSIKASAFYYCSSLSSITIPGAVDFIGEMAFSTCEKLTSITFKGTLSEWNSIAKANNWNDATPDYTIYCTDGTITKDGTVTYN